MWELNYKESWVQKTWCFWTVVLEKTLESPLACKEIIPVNFKGNQSWIFIGSSVHFSWSTVSNSLWPHGLQHARPPRSSPTPGVYPNSCPLSWCCHLTISSSVVLFSSCLQSFPASGSFEMSHLLASGGQSIGVSASTEILVNKFKEGSEMFGLVP